MEGAWICSDCLGQGIFLNEREYEFMSYLAHADSVADEILDSEYLS
jgi:hypothetical protein